MTPCRVGLVGYGDAGRLIHAPLLALAGLHVTTVSTSDPGRREAALAGIPGVEVVDDLETLLTRDLDLVVLASPTGVHTGQAVSCVEAGVPVVVDKPLATNAADADRVVRVAREANVPLTVFQNRRWDGEHVALRALLESGSLGEVFRFERRWERWRPVPKDRWRENADATRGGGILLDLHSHLVDSAANLFGPVARVYAELSARTTRAEDDAFLACTHVSGVRSHLGALSLAAAPGPRTRVLGTRAAYVVTSFESEPTAFADLLDESEAHCGWRVVGDQREPVPRPPVEHADFYRAVAAALHGDGAWPVDPWDAVHVLAVLDAARLSAETGQVRVVEDPASES
ncbi:MAG: Gfo/Idh/MocA family protein [Actinomycetes bacterium]